MSGHAPVVVSPECERVIRLLMITTAQHTRAEQALVGTRAVVGRLSVLPSATDASRTRRESVLVRLVSLTEATTYNQLQQRMERWAPEPRNAFVEHFFAQEEGKSTGTWDAARVAFQKWGPSVKLTAFTYWSDMLALIDARNTVVHGLGQFTRLQHKNSDRLINQKASLVALGYVVDEVNNRLITTPEALLATGAVLRLFLEHLDDQLASNPPF